MIKRIHSLEARRKMSLAHAGKKRPELSGERHPRPWEGKQFSQEHKMKISSALIGIKRPPFSEEHKRKIGLAAKGRRAWNYIEDRTKLKKSEDRRTTACKEWRKEVYKRDGWKCKIGNNDCRGHITAHHILPWRDYPELRYDINNGITLCFGHHPRKWREENRLSPYFQELLLVEK